MPTPVKPCEGRFSQETLELLTKNTDRAQWANHRCETCGLSIGATQDRGKWVPEQHWPTVTYIAHSAQEKKAKNAAATLNPTAASVIADSIFR